MTLDDGSTREADHILQATGYRIDISRYDFLSKAIVDHISTVDGYPSLDRRLESSVPGLYFVGAPAAWSYGPLIRFVAGAEFTSSILARGIVEALRRKTGTSNADGFRPVQHIR